MKDMVLKGLYRIHKPLKETDRAFIFEASHVQGKQALVVKILKDRYGRNAVFVERYANDVQATARLPEHANLVKILDADFISKRFCVVSEFFEGVALAERLTQGPLPYGIVLGIVRQLVSVMGMAYREGLPFRHVEMDNVLVDENTGDLKVLKFTTPRSATASASRSGQSASGLGTDLYLAGTLLFHGLVGEPPFRNRKDIPEIEVDRLKRAVMDGQGEVTPEELHSLSNLFLRACTRDVNRRFTTTEAFLQELKALESQSVGIRRKKRQEEKERKRASLDTAYDTVAALVGRRSLPSPPTPSEESAATKAERQALGIEENLLDGDDDAIRKRLVWKREPTASRWREFLSEEGPTLTTLIILLVIGTFLATIYIILS